MIEIHNLNMSYGSRQVLHNINLNIEKGSFNIVVGGNGAGKSTFINLLGSLLSADSGEIILDKQPLHKYKRTDKAKKIALLKQENKLDLNITVKDLVSFGRFPHSKGSLTKMDHEIIEHYMQKTATDEYAHRPINLLSGGQRQRAFLAMILAQQTDVILLDEPLASLDLKHSVEFVSLLKEICTTENRTVVMIVHDINIATMFADQIIALKDGHVRACGCISNVMNKSCLSDIFGVEFEVTNIDERLICFVK